MKPTSVGGTSRGNALWGRGGRQGSRTRGPAVAGRIALLVAITALAVPAAGIAGTNGDHGQSQDGNGNRDGMSQVAGNDGGGYVTPGLLAQAQANPNATFRVIVQGKREADAYRVQLVRDERGDLLALLAKQDGDADVYEARRVERGWVCTCTGEYTSPTRRLSLRSSSSVSRFLLPTKRITPILGRSRTWMTRSMRSPRGWRWIWMSSNR